MPRAIIGVWNKKNRCGIKRLTSEEMYVSDGIRVWYLYSFHLPAPQDTTPTITAFSVAGSTVISGPEKIRANENFLFVQSGLRAFHNNSFSNECQTQSAKVFALP